MAILSIEREPFEQVYPNQTETKENSYFFVTMYGPQVPETEAVIVDSGYVVYSINKVILSKELVKFAKLKGVSIENPGISPKNIRLRVKDDHNLAINLYTIAQINNLTISFGSQDQNKTKKNHILKNTDFNLSKNKIIRVATSLIFFSDTVQKLLGRRVYGSFSIGEEQLSHIPPIIYVNTREIFKSKGVDKVKEIQKTLTHELQHFFNHIYYPAMNTTDQEQTAEQAEQEERYFLNNEALKINFF